MKQLERLIASRSDAADISVVSCTYQCQPIATATMDFGNLTQSCPRRDGFLKHTQASDHRKGGHCLAGYEGLGWVDQADLNRTN